MDKPTKPTNLMPRSFGGIKNNFSDSMQASGFEVGIPTIYGGDNLNYQIDATGRELDYCEKIVDFVNAIPIGKTITVDSNNKLVYDNLSTVGRTGSYNDLLNKPTNLADKDLSNLTTIGNNKILPSQSGNNGKYLTTDGTNPSWADFTGANYDLSNLSTNGENRLHALKSYSDEGEILNDNEGLADIKSYAHSTFDASQFTVVGTPSVSDDGIITNFNWSNHLRLPNSVATNLESGAWRVDFGGTLNDPSKAFHIIGGSSIDNTAALQIGNISSNGKFSLYVRNVNGEAITLTIQDSVLDWNNAPLIGYAQYDGNETYTLAISQDNGATWQIKTQTFNSTVYFGSKVLELFTGATTYTTATADLKKFAIISNGVTIASGNKTGIDVIKSDDYTVVGTPTISADGVASGFSASDRIETASVNISGYSYEIDLKFRYPLITPSSNQTILSGTVANLINFYTGSNKKLYISLGDGSDWTSIHDQSLSTVFNLGDFIEIKIKYAAGAYSVYSSTNGGDWVQELAPTTVTAYSGTTGFNVGINRAYSAIYAGSIDLNSLKIYVNGNLIYQPCLKIPYTLSKTGSKVADRYVRDRINTMYEVYGFAPYYTLDEINGNFTLPQGEIYGMIERDLKMPDYGSGISVAASPYTAPDNGVVAASLVLPIAAGSVTLKINGTTVATDISHGNYAPNIQGEYLISKGDILTFESVGTITQKTITFFPFKKVIGV